MKAKQATLFALENVLHFYLLCPLSHCSVDVIAIVFLSFFLSSFLRIAHGFNIIVCYHAKWYRLELAHTHHKNGLHHPIGWISFKWLCRCVMCIYACVRVFVCYLIDMLSVCTVCIYDVNDWYQIFEPVDFIWLVSFFISIYFCTNTATVAHSEMVWSAHHMTIFLSSGFAIVYKYICLWLILRKSTLKRPNNQLYSLSLHRHSIATQIFDLQKNLSYKKDSSASQYFPLVRIMIRLWNHCYQWQLPPILIDSYFYIPNIEFIITRKRILFEITFSICHLERMWKWIWYEMNFRHIILYRKSKSKKLIENEVILYVILKRFEKIGK